MGKSNFATFVFTETAQKQIETLPPNIRLKFYEAICRYGLYGIEPDFDGLEYTVWVGMKDLIEHTKRNDEAWIEKQRENGRKGAEKRWQAYSENGEPIKPIIENGEPILPIGIDGLNEKDKDNENGNVNDKKKESGAEAPPFVFSENLSQKSPSPHETPAPSAKHDTSLHDPPPDKPSKTKDDAITVWNKARDFWNSLDLKPECRDLMMRNGDTSEILQTFQHYSWLEIKNAIDNYDWHKTRAGPKYKPPPSYGSLAGFLKTGVSRYFDDDALDDQFLEDRK